MWGCGSTEQCLWLGPGRYLRGRGRRDANSDANSNGNGDSIADTDPHAQVDAYGKGASHASSKALSFALPRISGEAV